MTKNTLKTQIEIDEKKSIYFQGFNPEQRKYIMDNFVFFSQGDKFHIDTIGPNPYGCFISMTKSDGSSKRAYCVDIFTNNGSIDVKVRPEGEFPRSLEESLKVCLNKHRKELAL